MVPELRALGKAAHGHSSAGLACGAPPPILLLRPPKACTLASALLLLSIAMFLMTLPCHPYSASEILNFTQYKNKAGADLSLMPDP